MIVGRIVSKSEDNMRQIIGFEDSTGYIDVTFYQKSDSSTPSALQDFEYREGEAQFARITGYIRVFKDQKSMVGINL
jgi:hypothetical protein